MKCANLSNSAVLVATAQPRREVQTPQSKGAVNLFKISAFVLAIGLNASAFGAISITETFDTDPASRGWSGVNNRTDPQDYGFSTGDVTGSVVNPPNGTATGGGEFGGKIMRQSSPANFYGVDLGGSLDISTDAFEVEGVIHLVNKRGGSGYYFGYGVGADSYGSGGNAANFIGVQFDDGFDAIPIVWNSTGGRERDTSPVGIDLIEGTTLPFSLIYDPAGNSGTGTLDVNIGVGSHTFNIPATVKDQLDPLTHLQIMPVSADANSNVVWLDDLTFTAVSVIPEPTTLALLGCAGLACLVGRRYAEQR